MKVQLNDIRHPDTWTGKEPINHGVGFDYCRKLIADGADPNETLEVYRGETLSRTYTNIGEAAKFRIREDRDFGPRVEKFVPLDDKAVERLRLNRARKKKGPGVDAFK